MRNDEPDRILIEYIYIRLVTVIPISSNFSATASTVPNSVLFMNTLEAGLCWIDWRARWATSHLSVRVFLSFSSAAGQLQAVDVDRARARERRQWQRARVSSQVEAHSQRREEVRKNIYIRRMVFFFQVSLCSANILLDSSGNAKLADFGVSKALDATTTTSVSKGKTYTQKTETIQGTRAYMAQEVFRGSLSVKVDAFAFGIVNEFKSNVRL